MLFRRREGKTKIERGGRPVSQFSVLVYSYFSPRYWIGWISNGILRFYALWYRMVFDCTTLEPTPALFVFACVASNIPAHSAIHSPVSTYFVECVLHGNRSLRSVRQGRQALSCTVYNYYIFAYMKKHDRLLRRMGLRLRRYSMKIEQN